MGDRDPAIPLEEGHAMALVQRLERHLKSRGVAFEVVAHAETHSAGDAALASHVTKRQLAKAVVLRGEGGRYWMLIVPASEHVDVALARHVTGSHRLDFAGEGQLARLFPDCEVGAIPPFGALWNMPVVLDECFEESEDIYFSAGNHHELVRMNFEDFRRTAGPFATEAHLHERPNL